MTNNEVALSYCSRSWENGSFVPVLSIPRICALRLVVVMSKAGLSTHLGSSRKHNTPMKQTPAHSLGEKALHFCYLELEPVLGLCMHVFFGSIGQKLVRKKRSNNGHDHVGNWGSVFDQLRNLKGRKGERSSITLRILKKFFEDFSRLFIFLFNDFSQIFYFLSLIFSYPEGLYLISVNKFLWGQHLFLFVFVYSLNSVPGIFWTL